MKRIDYLKEHLKPGAVYHRGDLSAWSSSVDRHLQQLVKEGVLAKVSGGLYYVSEQSIFGKVPPEEYTLINSFLKDNRFLIISPDDYNALGLGTTQLYNEVRVYNYKRHGAFKFGNLTYNFIRKSYVPSKITKEFLLVELMNNIRHLPEDVPNLLSNVKKRALELNKRRLLQISRYFGIVATRKFFEQLLENG